MGKTENESANEDDILSRIGSEPQAFEEFYDVFFPRLYNYFRLRNSEPELANELTAMTFEQAWLGLKKFRPKSDSFTPWLFMIAQNLMDEQLRFQKRRPDEKVEKFPGRSGESTAADWELQQKELWEAIQKLDEQERNLIALEFAAHMTTPQVARLLELGEIDAMEVLYGTLDHLRTAIEVMGYLDARQSGGPHWTQHIETELRAAMAEAGLPEEVQDQKIPQFINLIHRLAVLDFSQESQIRQSLGKRLSTHPPTQRWSWRNPKGLAHLLSPFQVVALVILSILLIIALIIAIYAIP